MSISIYIYIYIGRPFAWNSIPYTVCNLGGKRGRERERLVMMHVTCLLSRGLGHWCHMTCLCNVLLR